MNIMPVMGRKKVFPNRMHYFKYKHLFILSAIRSAFRLGLAAGTLVARLYAVYTASQNVREDVRADTGVKLSGTIPVLKAVAALAAVLALSTGCGSSANPPPTNNPPPANNPPVVANPGSQTGAVGEPANLQITASDADGDSLRFSAVGLPSGLQIHFLTGRISGSYDAAGNFAVIVTVTDSNDSARVEFSWNVIEPPNDPPVARSQLLFVEFDTSRAIVLAGSDPENDPLTFDVVEYPASGSLSGDPPNLTYTPDPGFSGTDSLQFTVWDGEYTSDPAVVTIIVRSESVSAPNILFVITDDIGMDTTSQMHPGLIDELTAQYGPQGHNHPFYRRIAGRPASTPVMNTLAQQGIVFAQTWAQPYCSPTRASILTGLNAAKTQVFDYADSLSQNHESVARILRDEAGYSTAIFGKWHVSGLGFYPGMKPKQAGFDLFLGNLSGALQDYWTYEYQIQDATTLPNRWRTEAAPTRSLPDIAPTTYAPVVKVADTIDWIAARENEDPDKPWFAWLAFNLSHITGAQATPTLVPNEDTLDEPTRIEMIACGGTFGTTDVGTCSDPALNRAMTNSLDTLLGKLLEAVDAIDPYTYVIVVGDNGTPMYGWTNNFIDNMYITRMGRAKGTVYESGVRVSLAVRGPGIAAGRQSAAINHSVDLFATILDLAGASVPASVPDSDGTGVVSLDSISLAPILFSDAESVRDPDYGYVMSETINPLANDARQAAARNATYKVLCEEDMQTSSCTFYDLIDDPLEEYPLPKPGSCFDFYNGSWTPADREWHFCSLQRILSIQSFLSGP